MSRWSTFHWSDGTLWSDGEGVPTLFTSFIDNLFYRLSLSITQVAPSGSTTAPTILLISAETGPRAQIDHSHVAFLDINNNTQHISVHVTQVSNTTTSLTTEADVEITTEADEVIIVDTVEPFVVDHVHLLANQRSRNQPVG